jgi:hypothetical protein
MQQYHIRAYRFPSAPASSARDWRVYSFAGGPRLFSSPFALSDTAAGSPIGQSQTNPVASWQLADVWMVGRYVLIPDHLHLFCTPVDECFTIESWITFWKRTFKRLHGNAERRFQAGGFHHRLRREKSYDEHWDYVRDNPVRPGLVKNAEEWPQRLKYLPPAAGCEISGQRLIRQLGWMNSSRAGQLGNCAPHRFRPRCWRNCIGITSFLRSRSLSTPTGNLRRLRLLRRTVRQSLERRLHRPKAVPA